MGGKHRGDWAGSWGPLLLLCWDRLRPLNMQAITYHQATGLSFFETGDTCAAQASLKDVLCLSLPADWDSSRYIPLSFSCDCSLKDHCLLSPRGLAMPPAHGRPL